MGFSEISFLFVFLPVSVLIYLLVELIFHNDRVNNVVLSVMSLVFYYWAGKESLILVAAIVLFTFFAGKILSWDRNPKTGSASTATGSVSSVANGETAVLPTAHRVHQARLVIPLVCLVGVLVFYKYVSFVAEWVNHLSGRTRIDVASLVVPIGLSFVIFESVSYVVDIYRGDAPAGNILDCLTFLSLFPKLVSGPIVLWKDFRGQLTNRRVSADKVAEGIDRIIIGYAKKAIFADTLGAQVATITADISTIGADVPTMWLRWILYFFQLYLDFSGYSDIAIGLCEIFGFEIKDNFRYPYLSRSITEFWRRWHISLGAWFREYVYIPLGGNRKGNVYIHLLIVFLLTGIWHGSTLPFLVWGAWHALFIIIERAIRNRSLYRRIPGILKWFFTIVIVFFGWILFASKDMPDVWQNCVSLFAQRADWTGNFTWQYYLSNRIAILLALAILGHITGIGRVNQKIKDVLQTRSSILVKRVLLLLLFVICILYTVNATYSPFIYFQF